MTIIKSVQSSNHQITFGNFLTFVWPVEWENVGIDFIIFIANLTRLLLYTQFVFVYVKCFCVFWRLCAFANLHIIIAARDRRAAPNGRPRGRLTFDRFYLNSLKCIQALSIQIQWQGWLNYTFFKRTGWILKTGLFTTPFSHRKTDITPTDTVRLSLWFRTFSRRHWSLNNTLACIRRADVLRKIARTSKCRRTRSGEASRVFQEQLLPDFRFLGGRMSWNVAVAYLRGVICGLDSPMALLDFQRNE